MLVSIPLVVVYPIGSRCFFVCYVFFTMICMELIKYVFEHDIKKMNKIKVISTILVIIMLINKYYIFNNINNQFEEIISYTEKQIVNKDVEIILLPNFKYQNYINLGIADFLGFLYYHNTPNDIKFKTIDRDKWEQIANNK